jgi:hypothetical protein
MVSEDKAGCMQTHKGFSCSMTGCCRDCFLPEAAVKERRVVPGDREEITPDHSAKRWIAPLPAHLRVNN